MTTASLCCWRCWEEKRGGQHIFGDAAQDSSAILAVCLWCAVMYRGVHCEQLEKQNVSKQHRSKPRQCNSIDL